MLFRIPGYFESPAISNSSLFLLPCYLQPLLSNPCYLESPSLSPIPFYFESSFISVPSLFLVLCNLQPPVTNPLLSRVSLAVAYPVLSCLLRYIKSPAISNPSLSPISCYCESLSISDDLLSPTPVVEYLAFWNLPCYIHPPAISTVPRCLQSPAISNPSLP